MSTASYTPKGSPGACDFCGAQLLSARPDPAGSAACHECGHLVWFQGASRDDCYLVVLFGTITHDRWKRVEKALLKRGISRLLIDLGKVEHMESAVLGSFINVKKKLGPGNRRFRLRNLPPDLAQVFRITRLDQIFEIE